MASPTPPSLSTTPTPSGGSSSSNSSSAPTGEQLLEIDGAVLDYLLYRGFTKTFRTMAADSAEDRLRNFDVDKVMMDDDDDNDDDE